MQENEYENVVSKMAAILFQLQLIVAWFHHLVTWN